ncbi:putative heme peroxidase [Polystyrenella longa]|uniref:Putative heme peroxidase n=1 Tax=Polystyrenella longa TaxID=2528007 RepID=A0A518CMY7_9PLAN|nr:hydrogen peroxide-dependent heme synthase [Polystyrenella longa]QDU80564.1 putative heme peroxidase [Polystyrenella longa]
MNRPTMPSAQELPDPTRLMSDGWHCLHLYYRINQSALKALTSSELETGRQEVAEILNSERDDAPARLQCFAVTGHRADWGLMAMDPDPLKIDAVAQAIRSSALGAAFEATYSFVSISEVSEYVPTLEQYAERLKRDGASPEDPSFRAKVGAYEKRLPMMNQQRLYPDFPAWPIICFYPMNKARHPQANWFMEPFSSRSDMMSEHATSGIKFAGKVSQLITASTGYDDWEWGVTLWGRAPEYIKDIVYTMRFDTASAKYAEFGPFYIGYIMSPADVLSHLRI